VGDEASVGYNRTEAVDDRAQGQELVAQFAAKLSQEGCAVGTVPARASTLAAGSASGGRAQGAPSVSSASGSGAAPPTNPAAPTPTPAPTPAPVWAPSRAGDARLSRENVDAVSASGLSLAGTIDYRTGVLPLAARAADTASLPESMPSFEGDGVKDDGVKADNGKKRRKTSKETVVERALAIYNGAEKSYAWDKHWEHKASKRDFNGKMLQLQSMGRRAGAFLTDEKALDLSTDIFKLHGSLTTRQDVFDEIRRDFGSFLAKALSPEEVKVFLDAPEHLLCTILTMEANAGLIDVVDCGRVARLGSFLQWLPTWPAEGGASCFLANGGGGSCDQERHDGEAVKVRLTLSALRRPDLAAQAQRGLVLNLWDRLYRMANPTQLCEIISAFSKTMPAVPFRPDSVDIDDVSSSHGGLFGQAWVDANLLVLAGEVLSTPNNGTLPRAVASKCVDIVVAQRKISPRVVACLTSKAGQGTNFTRAAWLRMQQEHALRLEQTGAGSSGILDVIANLQHALAQAVQMGTPMEVYLAFSDILPGHEEELKRFGRVHGNSAVGEDATGGVSAGGGAPDEMATSIAASLLAGVEAFLRGTKHIQSLHDQLYGAMTYPQAWGTNEEDPPNELRVLEWLRVVLQVQYTCLYYIIYIYYNAYYTNAFRYPRHPRPVSHVLFTRHTHVWREHQRIGRPVSSDVLPKLNCYVIGSRCLTICGASWLHICLGRVPHAIVGPGSGGERPSWEAMGLFVTVFCRGRGREGQWVSCFVNT